MTDIKRFGVSRVFALLPLLFLGSNLGNIDVPVAVAVLIFAKCGGFLNEIEKYEHFRKRG